MTIKETELTYEWQTLLNKLRSQYPPSHYKHIDVFMAFWQLVETVAA